MKSIIVAVILMLAGAALADGVSMSGHWQSPSGHRFFLYHKANGAANTWTVVANRQIGFETGKVTLVAPKDSITPAMYEIITHSDETVIAKHNGKLCEIKGLSFDLLGLLYQSGHKGRNMELRGVGTISGTAVCGKDKEPWSVSFMGSWKRM
jgi:hypothetical protein